MRMAWKSNLLSSKAPERRPFSGASSGDYRFYYSPGRGLIGGGGDSLDRRRGRCGGLENRLNFSPDDTNEPPKQRGGDYQYENGYYRYGGKRDDCDIANVSNFQSQRP